MNLFSQQGNKSNANLPISVFAFVLLSVGTSFGQSSTEATSDSRQEITTMGASRSVVKQEEASLNSNMNFALWFMGSKQEPNAKVYPVSDNAKRQFMTSGAAPNRLLITAFLKKAFNFETAAV